MKKYNIVVQHPHKNGLISIMCCFTVPDHITLEEVANTFRKFFLNRVDEGKRTGESSGIVVLACALQDVAENFNGSAYYIPADCAFLIG